MTLEEFIYQGANTSGISNVSTRGQPIGYPAPCKANIKKSIRIAIDENPNFKQFLEENHVYGRYIKNATRRVLQNVNPTRKLTECTHRIICGNDNGEIINDTLNWSNTSEGNNYWCNLYCKSYSSKKQY